MPLVACPVCDKPISPRAHACPGCGEPDPLNHVVKAKLLALFLWGVGLVGLAYLSWNYMVPMLIEAVR
ncbi:hypothetical protein [Vibrio sp. CAU 1672]|uniref:hypothetical protein n=1 Tax=Vibrio sp. CAU 1672 TaxID=3032594 RepID=UPI0023DA8CB7|nr:hypothetical protein [Vibrio sp. CAU 1672]MDF2155927.1 hypothetical protein [Vibrio sp. CAU 1672]